MQPTDNVFRILAANLRTIVEQIEPTLRNLTEEQAAKPVAPGNWSPKQCVGHLIDSACNNHARFVRAQLEGGFRGSSYDGDGWVRAGNSQAAPWPLLIDLWSSYNLYIAHILCHIHADAAELPCTIGDAPAISLSHLAEDYFLHLIHHLVGIGVVEEGSYPPYNPRF